jgi:polyhydroxyalkanoate synthesis repressor PhaR
MLLLFHAEVKRKDYSMEPKKIIIKKYENRRLYDVTHSRYVNLDEVARAVQDGSEVQVLDAATGDDLTRLVMTQIIVESAKGPDSAFPLDILRQMVVASGKASQESALQYMRNVAEMYKNALRGLTHTMSPFEIMQNMMKSVPGVEAPADQVSATVTPSAIKTDDSKADVSGHDAELQELKRRIQELEAMVLKSKDSPAPKKRAPKGARG